MIYSSKLPYRVEGLMWATGSSSAPNARSSGITQPPILAVAVEKVAHALPDKDRKNFVTDMLPVLVRFHEWIYRDRDPHRTGLAACVHPWECGMDDTPYWTTMMDHLPKPPLHWRWLREFRPVRPEERARPTDLQHMLALLYEVRRNKYDSIKILERSPVVVQDLVFNSILAAANESLERLSEMINEPVEPELHSRFAPTRKALELMWDNHTEQYFSKDFKTGALITSPTVATFMPLFAGTASPSRAERLRLLLADAGGFKVEHPLPSVPTTSPDFDAKRFWRGPVWVNMNWFVIHGLLRYGFQEEAEWLRLHTLGLIDQSGFREYFNPHTGDGLGGFNFSWTAALAIDLAAMAPVAHSDE